MDFQHAEQQSNGGTGQERWPTIFAAIRQGLGVAMLLVWLYYFLGGRWPF